MEFTLVVRADSLKNLRVGMQVKKNDIVKWQYVSPNSLEILDILKAVEHNFKEDIKRFTKWFTHKIEYYLKEISEIYYKSGEEFRKITLIALSVPILAFGVANTKFQPNRNIETIEVKKSDNVLVMSCNKTEVKNKREERKVIKKKVKMAATLKRIDKDIKKLEIKNKVQKLSPKKQAVTLLNQSEGLYVIPYWDYNQYSVGYGTYISYDECKTLWDRMGITEELGKDLAHEINSLLHLPLIVTLNFVNSS